MVDVATTNSAALDYMTEPRLPAQPTPLHSGIGVGSYLSLQIVGAVFPLAAGFLVFGWRALGSTVVVICSTLGATLVLRCVGWRGRQMRLIHMMWLGMLLSLMLPAHLFTLNKQNGQDVWPILPAAGIAVALLSWLLGGLGAQRVQPAVSTLLLAFVLFHDLLTPQYVLRADHLFLGDLLKADPTEQPIGGADTWLSNSAPRGYDALRTEPVADRLTAYTSAQQRPDRASLTMQMLIRDGMPPLEDLIVAGQSASIGCASAIALVIGGLFLLYRSVLDYRIPLYGILGAAGALLVLPIPTVISDTATRWDWLPFRAQLLGWQTALTFVNYELLASPLLLTLFFLANTPGLRPITHRGRAIFAAALGICSVIVQLYASVAIGPYVALLIVSLLTPTLDRFLRPRTLV